MTMIVRFFLSCDFSAHKDPCLWLFSTQGPALVTFSKQGPVLVTFQHTRTYACDLSAHKDPCWWRFSTQGPVLVTFQHTRTCACDLSAHKDPCWWRFSTQGPVLVTFQVNGYITYKTSWIILSCSVHACLFHRLYINQSIIFFCRKSKLVRNKRCSFFSYNDIKNGSWWPT